MLLLDAMFATNIYDKSGRKIVSSFLDVLDKGYLSTIKEKLVSATEALCLSQKDARGEYAGAHLGYWTTWWVEP